MINNSYLSDIVISLKDGQEVTAHSFILSLRSEVLAQVHEKAFSFKVLGYFRFILSFLVFSTIEQSNIVHMFSSRKNCGWLSKVKIDHEKLSIVCHICIENLMILIKFFMHMRFPPC